eukprot:s15850_g1.t1
MDFARTFGPSKSQPWASQAAFWSEFRPKPGRRILEKAEDCLRQVRDSPLRMQRVTSSCLHVRAPTCGLLGDFQVTAWRHAPGRRIDHDAIATAVVKRSPQLWDFQRDVQDAIAQDPEVDTLGGSV